MEKRYLATVNVVVRRQVKRENSSLPVAVRVSKTRVLKFPNYLIFFSTSEEITAEENRFRVKNRGVNGSRSRLVSISQVADPGEMTVRRDGNNYQLNNPDR